MPLKWHQPPHPRLQQHLGPLIGDPHRGAPERHVCPSVVKMDLVNGKNHRCDLTGCDLPIKMAI
jgi:hypothetical protein